jgi:hypothetical protein
LDFATWDYRISASGGRATIAGGFFPLNHLQSGVTHHHWGIAITSSAAAPPGIISARRRRSFAAEDAQGIATRPGQSHAMS